MKRRLLLFFILFSSLVTAQNNIYRSGGITQTVGAPTFTPGASGNIVAIDTVTGEWYVNPNRLSGSSWISAGYRLTNISGSVPPAYTPTAHQSHFVVNAANQLYYWNGSAWQSVGGGGSGDATRLKFLVVNKSGGTLNKGEVVYVSGAQGNRVAVKKALASADSLSANTLGVMDETVVNNGEGYCVAEGLVSGINTSAFTEGAALYLSPTTAGAITQTKTTAPDHLVLIGYCVKSNAGSGEISVHIQNGYELGELHDVYVPSPTNGQVLTYNTTNTRWEAATVADQSAANELQTIDTFSLSGQTLSASLSSDSQPAKTVTLPIIDVVAGTNVTVTKSNGVATVSATGGGGGSTSPAGSNGQIQFNSSGSFGASSNLFWDNANSRIGLSTASPSSTLDITGDFTEKNPNTNYDGPIIGAELATTGTGSNWSGSSFATGYTHATGSTATLTASSLSVVSSALYQVQYTISGRTAGSVTITLGGLSSGSVTSSGSLSRNFTTSTATLVITPTTDFDGSVIVSVKRVTQATSLQTFKSSSGGNTLQITNIPDNIIIGNNAGRFTSGVYNVFLGTNAGESNTSGTGNMFIGTNAGQSIGTGQNNVAVGYLALQNNQNGVRNLALGRAAGRNGNTSDRVSIGDSAGGGNFSVSIGSTAGGTDQSTNVVAIGYLAGSQSSTNSNSVYIGSISGYLNTIGQENTYIGYSSGYANTTGSNNVCIGSYAGRFTSTSSANSLMTNSILIGVGAAVNASGQTNQIVIGGTGLGSNTTTIGNTSTVQTHLYGNTTIGSNTTASARLHIQGSSNTSTTYSFIATNSGGSTTTPAICAQNDQKVGIGTNSVDSGATLEVDGTSGGILFPRLTTTQRDALTPTNGLMIYNTTDNKFQGYAGGAWVDLH